jgi:pilus assembly protein Flp/PilA
MLGILRAHHRIDHGRPLRMHHDSPRAARRARRPLVPLAPRRRHDRGASAVEYGLLVAAIAVVIVAVVFGLGVIVKDAFTKTTDCVSNSGAGTNCPTATP